MLEVILLDRPINNSQLEAIAKQRFGELVKAVVDVEKEIMAVGGELHADEESFLLDLGSRQSNLWGVNLYPGLTMPDRLEFDSMVNIRPSQGNMSRSVEDLAIRRRITTIVSKLISG